MPTEFKVVATRLEVGCLAVTNSVLELSFFGRNQMV